MLHVSCCTFVLLWLFWTLRDFFVFGGRGSSSFFLRPGKSFLFSVHSCRSSSVIFFDFWEGNLAGILREFCGTHKLKAQKLRGNIRSIFREKIRASKKSFVQTSFCRTGTLTFNGPIPVKTETSRELWVPLVHTNFGGNSYGPITGPYEFLGKFVWTNGSESSSKVSPYTGIGPWMALLSQTFSGSHARRVWETHLAFSASLRSARAGPNLANFPEFVLGLWRCFRS